MAKIEHDEQCERDESGYRVCHCEKRERLARGVTELPELIIQNPICNNCYKETWHDGDCYRCDNCHVAWSTDASDGDKADQFTDDYDWTDGDGVVHTLEEDKAAWLERKNQRLQKAGQA